MVHSLHFRLFFLQYSWVAESTKLRILHAFVHCVSRALRALLPHVPHVPHVSRVLCAFQKLHLRKSSYSTTSTIVLVWNLFFIIYIHIYYIYVYHIYIYIYIYIIYIYSCIYFLYVYRYRYTLWKTSFITDN